MSRNDSSLWSGGSGAANKLKLLREDKRDAKQLERSKLLPAADLVLAELKKDYAMTGEILLKIVDPNEPDEQTREKLGAVRLHREWITSFESRIKSILRHPKSNDKTGKEASFGESDSE